MSGPSETYCVTFGSTSDEKAVLPGIIAFTKKHPEMRVVVQYASIDNTPGKAKAILERLTPVELGYEAVFFITGAGMSNVLTGVCKATNARLNDLVIGVPLTDESSRGLTGFLSTVEKPPYNPIFTVGLNNTYAALEIAYRFMHEEVTMGVEGVGISERMRSFVGDDCEKLEKTLASFEIPFIAVSDGDIGSSSSPRIIISPFNSACAHLLKQYDAALERRPGIQIAYCVDPIHRDVGLYQRVMSDLGFIEGDGAIACTGLTTSLYPVNAAIVAAQLTRNDDAIGLIFSKRNDRVDQLNQHRGFVVTNGVIQP